MTPLAIGLVGAGAMGQSHIANIAGQPRCHLTAIADPSPEARKLAATLNVPCFSGPDEMFSTCSMDGVIIASPAPLHAAHGHAASACNIPMRMEKPVTHDMREALALCALAEEKNLAILVRHHRRHNPILQVARRIISKGTLGPLRAVSCHFLVHKPDDYFDVAWRRATGAGPVRTNLIHDIDTLRWLCGEITAVAAMTANQSGRSQTEDAAAITFSLTSGALATALVSDAAAAPWSWEMTARENPMYPPADADCLFIAGAKASLAIPSLKLWQHDGVPGWTAPVHAKTIAHTPADPFARQLSHFCDVIEEKAEPLVSARDAARTLAAALAIHEAAATGRTISLPG